MSGYQLLDSGNGRKLERFGRHVVDRPCMQAVWAPRDENWDADAIFERQESSRWIYNRKLPKEWLIEWEGLKMEVIPTDFGHLGIFPEHAAHWEWLLESSFEGMSVLNLFAYTGAATLAMARAGAKVTHVDASKKSVAWASRNAAHNGLGDAPIRWIVDDALKFLHRQVRRGAKYDGIILDPPTFGRGPKGELFKLEERAVELVDLCQQLLSDEARFLLFSCHTPGLTPLALSRLFSREMETGEMAIASKSGSVPSGSYARWKR